MLPASMVYSCVMLEVHTLVNGSQKSSPEVQTIVPVYREKSNPEHSQYVVLQYCQGPCPIEDGVVGCGVGINVGLIVGFDVDGV